MRRVFPALQAAALENIQAGSKEAVALENLRKKRAALQENMQKGGDLNTPGGRETLKGRAATEGTQKRSTRSTATSQSITGAKKPQNPNKAVPHASYRLPFKLLIS